MTVKSQPYRPALIQRLKNPAYAAAFLNAILEETDPEPELLESALRDIATALGDRLTSAQLEAHQDRLYQLLAKSHRLSIADLMTWLEPFGLRLLVMANLPPDENQVSSSPIAEAS
jgi:DNA-binding phage protein